MHVNLQLSFLLLNVIMLEKLSLFLWHSIFEINGCVGTLHTVFFTPLMLLLAFVLLMFDFLSAVL